MRRLGKPLGVEAMSLYNHVANKDEILDGIVGVDASEIDLPSDGADWKTAIRQSAISARDGYLRHPWACSLSMSRQSGGPAQLQRSEWMLRTLREAGLPKDVIYHAFHIVETFLEQLHADEYPDFVEHVMQHLEPRRGDEGGFELGLDLILDGLERLRDTA
jgi:AcrR family transcriptional regulator